MDVHSTSTLGSLGLAPGFKLAPTPAYKISKTALNMLTVQWAQDMADEGFTIIGISPGVRIRSRLLRMDLC